jgi:histidinol-phosphate phosphatase family protein
MSEAFYQFHPSKPLLSQQDSPIAFLDRDGVINIGYSTYVNSPEEMKLIDGAAQAIAHLKNAGYTICVITNQSPIERMLWDHHTLAEIHERMIAQLENIDPDAQIDLILACPHKFSSSCVCRKPESTLLRFGASILRGGSPMLTKKYGMTKHHLPFFVETNWFGKKPTSEHPLDIMVGDRRTDEGAGWGFGTRIFRIHADSNLEKLVPRILDVNDEGDDFHP